MALSKRLSAKDLVGFGIGIVIGSGIFTLTGIGAKNYAGPGIVFSFLIAGHHRLCAGRGPALTFHERRGAATGR